MQVYSTSTHWVDDGEAILSNDSRLNEAYQNGTWRQHLAVLTPGWIDLILNRKKKIESRFTKVRCAPFGRVNKGDTIFMKESSGLVRGMFTVAEVETFEHLTEPQINEIWESYAYDIFVNEVNNIPEKWQTSQHATLIHIGSVSSFMTPFAFPKKDRRAWIVFDRPLVKI